jgi:Na+-transporting NADH:ubiquinone oxidoreductase subunit C
VRQTNAYTFIFITITAVITALLLSFTSQSLKEKQQFNVETDMKKNILIAVGVMKEEKCFDSQQKAFIDNCDVLCCYKKNISSFAVDYQGKIKADKELVPERIIPDKEKEKPQDKRSYPVFAMKTGEKITSYCIPIIGKGLWGSIYGYIALSDDLDTVKGITFYKHAETPGLGAEIETEWFKKSFNGKKIINDKGELVSVTIVKGKVDPNSANAPHEVDGISGATLTGRGVNRLLKESLALYEPYFKTLRKEKK